MSGEEQELNHEHWDLSLHRFSPQSLPEFDFFGWLSYFELSTRYLFLHTVGP
jgi:hypothetical protein